MNIRKNSGWLIHIAIWAVILAMPFFSPQPGRALHGGLDYSRFLPVTISFVIVFYTNYLFLIKHFLSNKRFGAFLFWNMLLITKVSIGVHLFFRYLISPDIAPPHHSTLDTISFTFRNTVIYMAIVGIAVAVKMTTEWYNNEAQRKEIEKNQAEAELANLKNQVNPHFLFNTVNNIYSLIQIDPAQAQEAVHDLSGMLRYVLYESQKDTVPLAKECEFLNEYVNLMGARLTSEVKLEVSLPSSLSNRQIAPDESFIRIELREDGEYVTCLVENSCFPKDGTDRSGSGIGITNLKRRLDLLYPGAYSFEYGRAQSVYRSLLRIRTGI